MNIDIYHLTSIRSDSRLSQARVIVPRVLILSFLIAVIFAVINFFAVASSFPGLRVYASMQREFRHERQESYCGITALNCGFYESLYGHDHSQGVDNSRYFLLLTLPVLLTRTLVYSYFMKKQLASMALSKLVVLPTPALPSSLLRVLQIDLEDNSVLHTEVYSLLYGSATGYLLLLFIWLIFDDGREFRWFIVSVIATCISQLGNLWSFLRFRRQYSTLARKFRSPLGNFGAIYGNHYDKYYKYIYNYRCNSIYV